MNNRAYNTANIRQLLLSGFTSEELRIICYDHPDLYAALDRLGDGMGKSEIVSHIIAFCSQHLLLGTLLEEARRANPARYALHQPYDQDAEEQAVTSEVSSSTSGSHSPAADPVRPEPPDQEPAPAARNQVFISYSHQDAEWLQRVLVHLKPLEDAGVVNVWNDTRIKAGSLWRQEITKALNTARVAVLLVSADFLASDFIRGSELPPLLEAAENDQALILPLILRPCLYSRSNLGKYQAVNDPKRPLSALPKHEQEQVLVDLAERIAETVGFSAG